MTPNWDDRYSNKAFAYGTAPNAYFKEQLQKLNPGNLLMPADGEGRNGVYAATCGWRVVCTDLSIEGKKKALDLAESNRVTIEYMVGDLDAMTFEKDSFDCIGLIYAHFSADAKSNLHKKLISCLKPGGMILFEAFSKNHLQLRQVNPKVGGPNDIDMLFSTSEIENDFSDLEILLLEETEIELKEGLFHNGKGSVIRFIGKKP